MHEGFITALYHRSHLFFIYYLFLFSKPDINLVYFKSAYFSLVRNTILLIFDLILSYQLSFIISKIYSLFLLAIKDRISLSKVISFIAK